MMQNRLGHYLTQAEAVRPQCVCHHRRSDIKIIESNALEEQGRMHAFAALQPA